MTALVKWTQNERALMIFHGPDHMYALPNSYRGIDWAHSVGANAIDSDIQVTKDGYIVITHWSQPLLHWVGYRDITGHYKIDNPIHISQMMLSEVKNLRYGKENYQINELRGHMARAAKLGITVCLEQKGDYRLARNDTWVNAKREIDSVRGNAIMMTLPDMSHAHEAITAAGHAGIKTLLLTRGAVPTSFYDAGLSAVKGPVQRNYGLPSDVVRLGTSYLDATRYGCSVGPGGTVGARRAIKLKGGHF